MKSLNKKIMAGLCIGVLSMAMVGCTSTKKSETKAFEGEKIEEIDIKTEGANIEVRPSNDKDVKVSVEGEKELLAEIEGNVLKVNIEESSGFLHLKSATVYLDVPDEKYQKINLITDSGNISAKNLKAEELMLSTDSGKVKMKYDNKPDSLQMDVATQSGKIKSSLAPSSSIKSKGAGYELKDNIGNGDGSLLIIRSTSGNIELE